MHRMINAFARRALQFCHCRLGFWALISLLACGVQLKTLAEAVPARHALAGPVLVRHTLGTVHGFLVQRNPDGQIVATGDSVQVAHGDQVTSRTTFTYKDGSVDEETTVFSQRQSFKLISDHHIQKGPFFTHPMDLMIDGRSGEVTVHTTGKDGKEVKYAEHMNLPLDVANGMVSQLIGNIKVGAQPTTVSMVVTTPKPRIVKLAISSVGDDSFAISGAAHKAMHCQIQIQIGGFAGMVAPLVGKAPPTIEIWEVGGEAPTFLREIGPTFEDGPVMTIELASPEWPKAVKAGG